MKKPSERGRVRAPRLPADRDRLIADYEFQSTQARMREQVLHRKWVETQNQASYHAGLFNGAPFGYMIIDNIGGIREINEAGAALLRRERKDLIKESLARFIPRESLPEFLEHYRVCRLSRDPVASEVTLRLTDGTRVPVELVSSAFQHTSRATHFRTAIINISERQHAEDALRDTQKNYRNLINSIEGIVWECDEKGNFTFVSHQAESLGYPLDRWLREPQFWRERIHVDDRERVMAAHAQGLENEKPFVIEFRVHNAQRRVVWLRNSVNVLRVPSGPLRLRGVMVNITELKDKEAALQDETQMLEILNRMGTALAGELDMPRLAAIATKAGVEVTGAKFGAFSYRQFNGHQKKFLLYTTEGAPRELFDRLPLPPHRPEAPPADESEIIRIEDTLQDARAPKPLLGAPNGQQDPVMRSYLAMPVVSRSGEVLGGLLFGHPRPGVFTERSQRLLVGISAQAAVALDNARLYHAVSASESHFRQMADAMPQIVWTAEPDGTVNYLNRRWYEYTGQPEGTIGEDGWLSILHADDCARCSEAWREALASKHRFEIQCRLREKDSEDYRWHLIRAVPVLAEKGRVIKWFGTCTNIDEQKQAEKAVRQMNTALEQRVEERTAQLQVSNKELEAFNYSVSHDLRAPLRSISAFSQLLEEDYRDKLDDQGKDYLRIIGESTQHMSRLIDGLLHLSRITRGDIHPKTVDLGKVAEEIIGRLRQAEPQRVVETMIAPDMKVEGDEGLLRIALENLLINAWKFTAKVPHARIEFGSEMQAQGLVYYVRDNGAGFDMAYAGKLFGAFMRLHTTAEFPGHGIGLAIVQRVINRHGGRIWARAAVDHGATFYFVLPKVG